MGYRNDGCVFPGVTCVLHLVLLTSSCQTPTSEPKPATCLWVALEENKMVQHF